MKELDLHNVSSEVPSLDKYSHKITSLTQGFGIHQYIYLLIYIYIYKSKYKKVGVLPIRIV